MRQRAKGFGAAFRRAAWHTAQNVAGRFRDFLDLVDRLAGEALLLRSVLIDRGDVSYSRSAGRIIGGRRLSRLRARRSWRSQRQHKGDRQTIPEYASAKRAVQTHLT